MTSIYRSGSRVPWNYPRVMNAFVACITVPLESKHLKLYLLSVKMHKYLTKKHLGVHSINPFSSL